MDKESVNPSSFPRGFLRTYALVAASKIAAFSFIAYVSVSGSVSTTRLILGVSFVIVGTLYFEYFWFYRKDITMQKELIQKRGDKYCVEFQSELNRIGQFQFVASRWVHRRYEECFPKQRI